MISKRRVLPGHREFTGCLSDDDLNCESGTAFIGGPLNTTMSPFRHAVDQDADK